MKRSLLANSTVVVICQVWAVLLTLAITPRIYRLLGSEGYGLFSLVLVLANYLTIMDFGFGWGIIRFVAQYADSGDFKKMEAVIRVSVWMSLALGFVMAAALTIAAPWLAHSVFQVEGVEANVTIAGIVIAGGTCILILHSNVLVGVLKGLRRFDLAVGLRSVSTTVRMVGYLLLLRAGYGLRSLWVLTLVSMLICEFAYGWSVKRLIPAIRLFPKFNRQSFKEIFSFSVFGFGTRLLTLPYFYLDKLFIGAMLPVAALSYYIIPFNLSQKIGGIGGLVVSVLFPSASARHQDRDRLQEFYRRVVPLVYSLILPMILVAVSFGPQFLRYWMGREFASVAALPLILLVVGMGAITLGSIDGTFVESVGRPRIRTILYLVLAIISLPMCYVLTRAFGINGTAATVCVAFCAGGLFEIFLHHGLITKSLWYFKRILPCAMLLSGGGLAAGWMLRPFATGLWSTIGAGALLYLLLALLALRIFHTDEQFRADLARFVRPAFFVVRMLHSRALSPFRR